MKYHACTCIQCCNARTVSGKHQEVGLNTERWKADLAAARDRLKDVEAAAHVAKYPDTFATWLPKKNDPTDANVAPFFGLDRSAPSSLFSRPLPKVPWWSRIRWALGRWLSRGAPE